MLKKIQDIKNYLNTVFVEREEVIDDMLACLIARQHMLLIGLPGTAKSAIIKEFSSMVSNINYFEMLLTRFSTPEELFGPLSLKQLEQNEVYKRNVNNMLPLSQIGFVDEIFKANSAILNSLLTLINERKYHNGDEIIQSPLMSIFGGSNEYPEEEEGLEALFDRFLIRHEVDYISEDKKMFDFLKNANRFVPVPQPITIDEISNLQMAAENVDIPDDVLRTLVKIRSILSNEGIRPSDRRFKQSLSILRAKAILDGRTNVKISDIAVLKNGLWETVDQKARVIEVVMDYAVDKVDQTVTTVKKTMGSLLKQVQNNPDSKTGTDVTSKGRDMIEQLKKLKIDNPTRATEIDKTINEIVEFNKQVSMILIGAATI